MKKLLTLLFSLFVIFIVAQEPPRLMRMHIVELAAGSNNSIAEWSKVWETQSKKAVEEGHWAGWIMLRGVEDPKKIIFFHLFDDPSQIRNVFSKFKSPESLDIGVPEKWPKWKTIEMDMWEPRSTVDVETTSNFYAVNFWKFSNSQRKNFIKVNELFGDYIAKPRAKIDPSKDWGYATRITGLSYENNQPISANGVSFDGYESYEKLINSRLSNQKKLSKYATKADMKANREKMRKEMDDLKLWGKWNTGREILLFEVVGSSFR
ncbi:hypothetical protein N9M92_06110 [Flavobacteriaceae bacterium]|nr:hypothetical protein [Flavobacteriaceae bacterium]